MRTNSLIGSMLDYWVAMAQGENAYFPQGHADHFLWIRQRNSSSPRACPFYSTNWANGGPILEREGIWVVDMGNGRWLATTRDGYEQEGPTYLIAGMRCYVAKTFGEIVPDADDRRVQFSGVQGLTLAEVARAPMAAMLSS